LEACPELGTPATPARPRNIGRPDAAFRLVNGVGIATSRVFGAESSRPASLLCTLRIHQSPGEWQHSLSACVLALAVRDLHPLDSIKGFSPSHLRLLPFHAYPSAITTPALSRVFFFFSTKTRTHFSVGARTASFSAASVHLGHPNLLSPFTIINSVLPTKHLFDHHRP